MGDKELVADMRETVRYWEHIYPRDTWGSYQRAHEQAADRIEALIARLAEAEALAEALRLYWQNDGQCSYEEWLALQQNAGRALRAWGAIPLDLPQ